MPLRPKSKEDNNPNYHPLTCVASLTSKNAVHVRTEMPHGSTPHSILLRSIYLSTLSLSLPSFHGTPISLFLSLSPSPSQVTMANKGDDLFMHQPLCQSQRGDSASQLQQMVLRSTWNAVAPWRPRCVGRTNCGWQSSLKPTLALIPLQCDQRGREDVTSPFLPSPFHSS